MSTSSVEDGLKTVERGKSIIYATNGMLASQPWAEPWLHLEIISRMNSASLLSVIKASQAYSESPKILITTRRHAKKVISMKLQLVSGKLVLAIRPVEHNGHTGHTGHTGEPPHSNINTQGLWGVVKVKTQGHAIAATRASRASDGRTIVSFPTSTLMPTLGLRVGRRG